MSVSKLACLFLLSAEMAGAAPVLVVAPPADTAALRAALVEGGVATLSEAETAQVLSSAANSGVVCAADDVACWQAVATLAGHDEVVVLTTTDVVSSSPAGVRRTPRLLSGPEGVRGAVLRQLGRAGAVIVQVRPSSAKLTLNGAPLAGATVDALPAGTVGLSAAADGFVTRSEDVVIVAGDVARVDWTLVEPEVSAAGLSPVLFWGGVSTIGVGVVTGAAIAGINFQANCRFDSASPTGIFCRNEEAAGQRPDHPGTKAVDIAAIAIGAGLSAVGAGAAVASLFVE